MNIVDSSGWLAYFADEPMKHHLPMADSIILATAREFAAVIRTQDSDFKNISDVKYFPKK